MRKRQKGEKRRRKRKRGRRERKSRKGKSEKRRARGNGKNNQEEKEDQIKREAINQLMQPGELDKDPLDLPERENLKHLHLNPLEEVMKQHPLMICYLQLLLFMEIKTRKLYFQS